MGRELKLPDGLQTYRKHFMEPPDGMTQTLHIQIEEYALGGRNGKHGHANEAMFYNTMEGIG